MKVEYAPAASKQFSRLDKPMQSRIKKYMSEIASLNNPRSRGKALSSNLSGLWRYRVGDYRRGKFKNILLNHHVKTLASLAFLAVK